MSGWAVTGAGGVEEADFCYLLGAYVDRVASTKVNVGGDGLAANALETRVVEEATATVHDTGAEEFVMVSA